MELRIEESAAYINNAVSFRKSVFDKIADKNPNQVWLSASLKDVQNVVIINSAPRSGSSLLFAILKKIPQFYSLSGEEIPFYKLNGLSCDTFPSDEIPEAVKEAKVYAFGMSRDFLSDFSIAGIQDRIIEDNELLERYIDDLALRFPLEWPQIDFSYDVFKRLARQAFDNYREIYQGFSKEAFYLELLWLLRREYKTINPYYYDIPAGMIEKKFPELEIPSAPPNPVIMIEEPPFILLSPRIKVSGRDLAGKTLLLKSSTNCYRMRFIEALLPNADIKIIYLVRNPAASINGLYDGWLYRGFFSHNLRYFFEKNKKDSGPETLKIFGYSDKYEWGRWWWKYDLPPGWQSYAHSKLEEVCGFQWYAANRAIQEYLKQSQKNYCLVSYENIIRSLEFRKKEIKKIMNFIGIRESGIEQLGLDNLSIIQATDNPQPYRWKKRRDVLLPVLKSPGINRMSGHLGYNKKDIEEWL
ncbi:MAG: sulfotransferase domain-containing protein [Candidatus Omnitrophota bacterium]